MELKQKTFKELTAQEKESNPEYAAFLKKFENNYTTDDCFTPPNIYDCIKSFVAKRYELDPNNFVRPFYPGGDYEAFHYPTRQCSCG